MTLTLQKKIEKNSAAWLGACVFSFSSDSRAELGGIARVAWDFPTDHREGTSPDPPLPLNSSRELEKVSAGGCVLCVIATTNANVAAHRARRAPILK